ncbi:MAG: GPR endopeptidase [Oscillospiraceae bacterium]|nr:GPR endopeptidase [Oscillospiraceae bacterium]
MNYRTDLAMERRELIKDSIPDGVLFDEQIDGKTKITRIEIQTSDGAAALGKPIGHYITLEIPQPSSNPNESEKEIELIAKELTALIPQKGCVLVAGLGNHNITPDAIGPKTVEATLSTRHVAEKMPHLNFRAVAALAPGVMGQTGIETGDVIRSVCGEIDAACVIAVDALASRSTHRLGCTVQISDTGISPGSGVGNKRAELSEKTLGVPVIAIGVPTVVDARTIAADAISEEGQTYIDEEKLKGLMVTPREIDNVISGVSKVLALSIGRALQPALSVSDLYFLTL